MRLGAITSAADTVELVLDSPGGHTSRPHLTTDLVYALGTVITGLPGMLSRRIDPRTSTVMVWGAVSAGQAPNAIPQTGMLTGTVRTGDHETWALLEPLVREIVHGLLAPTGVRYQLNYRRGVPPVVNDEVSTRMFEDAIRRDRPGRPRRHAAVRRRRGLLLVPRGGSRRDGPAGRVVGRRRRSSTSTSPPSTWTSARSGSASGCWRTCRAGS